MTARTPDALASALPAGIHYDNLAGTGGKERWTVGYIAAFQAERLAESGYVLVHTAPDEATVERLARALYTADGDDPVRLEILPPVLQRAAWDKARRQVEAVLAALADTSAQARHTAGDARMADDRKYGAYAKYHVARLQDETGKHNDCWYFVLDIRHDEHARVALADYANSCREDYPRLAADLTERLRSTPYEGGASDG